MPALVHIQTRIAEYRPQTLAQGIAIAVSLAFFYFVGRAFYNVYVHPLRHVPGPKLWAATRIPYTLMILRGTIVTDISDLHKRYGDVVRVTPGTVHFLHEDWWKEGVGFIKGNRLENGKDPVAGGAISESILVAPRAAHTQIRRTLAHSFSVEALQKQEAIVEGSEDMLFKRLHEWSKSGPLDMASWYNMFTFDVIGDLTFGEPFGSLKDSKPHQWLTTVFDGLIFGTVFPELKWYKLPMAWLLTVLPKRVMEKRTQQVEYTHAMTDKRMAMATDRPDFMWSMMNKSQVPLTRNQILHNVEGLIVAGSETTATALSGTTYLLLTNPACYAKANAEVRSSFTSENDITMRSTMQLRYLNACIEETLRVYPPVPVQLNRVVAPEGAGEVLGGYFIPPGTRINTVMYAMYHSAKYFAEPDSYRPERWLGEDPRFAGDRKELFNPFSTGPRSCIGINLAYAELRVVMARLLWNFDLELDPRSRDWMGDQKVFIVWEKDPLYVKLSPRQH